MSQIRVCQVQSQGRARLELNEAMSERPQVRYQIAQVLLDRFHTEDGDTLIRIRPTVPVRHEKPLLATLGSFR